METRRFYKEGGSWYIDLPEYLAQGGSLGELQMVAGADTMLDRMAGGAEEVWLLFSPVPFDGADELVMTARCAPEVSGAYYLLKQYEGQYIEQPMWLCGVTDFVFGELPSHIYIKRVASP
jgi:hypothetical protein